MQSFIYINGKEVHRDDSSNQLTERQTIIDIIERRIKFWEKHLTTQYDKEYDREYCAAICELKDLLAEIKQLEGVNNAT